MSGLLVKACPKHGGTTQRRSRRKKSGTSAAAANYEKRGGAEAEKSCERNDFHKRVGGQKSQSRADGHLPKRRGKLRRVVSENARDSKKNAAPESSAAERKDERSSHPS